MSPVWKKFFTYTQPVIIYLLLDIGIIPLCGYTQEEGKEIFDSLEYLASTKKGWKGVVESLKERLTDIQTRIKNGASDPEVTVTPQELLIGKNLVNLLKHWPQVKAWYLSQDTNFGLELLEDEVDQETRNKFNLYVQVADESI